jgi:hypothetical protein
MRQDEAIFEAVIRALAEQHHQPERFGGGLIGKAQAVVLALGVDGDAPVSSLPQMRSAEV